VLNKLASSGRAPDLLPVVPSPASLESTTRANRLLGGDVEATKHQRELAVPGRFRLPNGDPHLRS
jgi:hypothetical protein